MNRVGDGGKEVTMSILEIWVSGVWKGLEYVKRQKYSFGIDWKQYCKDVLFPQIIINCYETKKKKNCVWKLDKPNSNIHMKKKLFRNNQKKKSEKEEWKWIKLTS